MSQRINDMALVRSYYKLSALSLIDARNSGIASSHPESPLRVTSGHDAGPARRQLSAKSGLGSFSSDEHKTSTNFEPVPPHPTLKYAR
jgi:hypothetical protein